jgi:hypothetical protein
MNGLLERQLGMPPLCQMPMRFALEPYSEKLVQEMRPLWDAHHDEVPQLRLPIDPDLALYSQMAKNGVLRIFTARVGADWESTLVGYQVFGVMRHPHRRYSLEANGDLLYLDPEVRKGMVAMKFLKYCDTELAKEGVKVIHHQFSVEKNLTPLFRRLGYEIMDLTMARKV